METPDNYTDAARAIGALGSAGLIVGLGQLLASGDTLTWRLVIGRALLSAGLGASAAGILAWLPDLPLVAQLGIACLMASLGTSGLEKLLQRILGQTK